MTILQMIAEWEKGCACSMRFTTDDKPIRMDPWFCRECTEALIAAIKKKAEENERS